MKTINLIASFEHEINKFDDVENKPTTDDSLYWLNQGIVKFTKDRFNGNAPKRTSYEQNEKRTRDLINLLAEDTYGPYNDSEYIPDSAHICDPDTSHADYDVYDFTYPQDMMFVLNEDVEITDADGGNATDTSVFECTADNFMYRVKNSLTDFHYKFHTARPLRIRTNGGFRLLTDKNYKINKYTLGYIKIPTVLTSEDPDYNCTDFPEYIWPEIVKIAAQMYVENQADPRYKTLTNEVLTQE